MGKRLCLLLFFLITSQHLSAQKYLRGDLHQHTTFTDGSNSMKTMMYMSNKYQLDWWLNSEHGGGFTMDALGELDTIPPFDEKMNAGRYWDSYNPKPIIGDSMSSGGHQRMWQWQALRNFMFPAILEARATYPGKLIALGVEWNVPGHEHCSVGILTNQFDKNPNCIPLAEFEYKYDNSDRDTSGGMLQGWSKSTQTGHAKAIEAIEWLQQNHPTTSWVIFNHPERKNSYTVADFRDFSNAGPSLAMGFESMPGHQKGPKRGEYSKKYNTTGGCTYGGVGIFAAKVGGLWDALLGEGRKWWLYTNSDCHAVGSDSAMRTGPDFWPGEYNVMYVNVGQQLTPQSLVDGLKSGDVWIVSGDLIDSLSFKVNNVSMGQWAHPDAQGKVTISVTVRDPNKDNYNTYSDYKNPSLHHIDIIAGEVTGLKQPGTAEYADATNPTTKVIARFDDNGGESDANSIVSQKWTRNGEIISFTYTVSVQKPMYFRLRGTNHPLNKINETDAYGNPLPDTLISATAASAFDDLWFYSNPIFVSVPTSVNEEAVNTPATISLSQNYPNPFNPVTNITYSLSKASNVKLVVYDLLGRQVATLVNSYQPEGVYTISFDGSEYASGVYYYRLETDYGIQTKSMLLAK